MKKVIVLILTLLLVGGCAGFGKWSTGMQAAVDSICNPTEAQKAEAAKWLAAMDAIQGGVATFFPPLAIIKASSAMTVLKNGGCFVLAEIEAALTLLSDMQTKVATTKGFVAAPVSSEKQFPVLWATVKRGK